MPTPTEPVEHKDLQDHRFGMKAADLEEKADRASGGDREEEEKAGAGQAEPHAGGRA